MTVEEAVEKATELLRRWWRNKPPKGTVRIHTWGTWRLNQCIDEIPRTPYIGAPRAPYIGVRVAEIDWWSPARVAGTGAGTALMQVDVPVGLAACAAAERLIIAYAEGWMPDEIRDEEARLLGVCYGQQVLRDYLRAPSTTSRRRRKGASPSGHVVRLRRKEVLNR